MIAQIIPIDASYDSQALTYFVPESLRSIEIGQLVEMPFRDEITYGVVSAVVDFSGVIPDEIRAIVQIVFLTPILNPAQIQTICEIAKESVLHLHKVLALFLPKPVLIRMLKYGIGTSAEVPMPEPSKILKQKPVLHFLKNPEMLASYSQSLDTGKTVYIVPSDWYLSRLQMLFPTNTTGVLPGGMTDTKRAQLWLDVRVMKYPTLIWIRRLCTYNLAGFDRIVFLEDAIMKDLLHSFHRYDCLNILEKLTHISNTELHIVSSTPAISTISHTLATHFELINA